MSSFETEFGSMLIHQVSLIAPGVKDKFGERAHMSPVGPYPCRIERRRREVRSATGQTQTVEGTVFMRWVDGFDEDWKVYFDGIAYNIASVDYLYDETSQHHLEIEFVSP